jgi:hypothetical protein
VFDLTPHLVHAEARVHYFGRFFALFSLCFYNLLKLFELTFSDEVREEVLEVVSRLVLLCEDGSRVLGQLKKYLLSVLLTY